MTEQEQLVAEDSSPRHKHLRKLAMEAEALKKSKASIVPVVSYEVVYDSRGKPKHRKIFRMPNGTKHWQYVSPKNARN